MYVVQNMILNIKYIFPEIFAFQCISSVLGHGMLMDPVNRSSAWRKYFTTPINYDDNANYCGGYYIQHVINHGQCGVCGDDYSLSQPRPNENGGVFGTGQIVKTYTAGQAFVVSVKITSNHMGYFEFALCPIINSQDIESEECFEKYPIFTRNGEKKYIMKKFYVGNYEVPLVLPKNITCNHCSIRWTYITGNNWNICPDGGSALGCGPQETFRTCSDIRIIEL